MIQKKNEKARKFIETLVSKKSVQDFELYDDQGVKVSTHTYDVLQISINELLRDYKTLKEAKKKINFFVLTIGILIHDLSKVSIRKQVGVFSHSQMMLKKPDYIKKDANLMLSAIEQELGIHIKEKLRKNILHIVLSHHGKWGKIQPNTREAHIVCRADMYSAKYHRINPIGATDILKLLDDGVPFEELATALSCTQGVIKDRLKRAKQELNLQNTKQLFNYYKKNKNIPIGDDFFVQRVEETVRLKKMVEKNGFTNLILNNPLTQFMDDSEIFETEKSNVMKKRLDTILVERDLTVDIDSAKRLCMAGVVLVNDKKVDKAGTMLDESKIKSIRLKEKNKSGFVSRGGLKLEKAIKTFNLDFKDKIVLDVGASTGGFTDCSLKNGAKFVYAVDVGTNQLDWKLRQNSKVKSIENTHINDLTLEEINNSQIDFIVMDVSFISVKKIIYDLKKFMDKNTQIVLLIKPQFEAQKDEIEKGGIVSSVKVHERIIDEIIEYFKSLGIVKIGLTQSPIRGTKGNIEYLALFKNGEMDEKNI